MSILNASLRLQDFLVFFATLGDCKSAIFVTVGSLLVDRAHFDKFNAQYAAERCEQSPPLHSNAVHLQLGKPLRFMAAMPGGTGSRSLP